MMDTQTGRVYLPDEFMARKRGDIDDDHQQMFMRRFDEGKIVEVSNQVAMQQLMGQAQEARKKLRKAQKQARKKQR